MKKPKPPSKTQQMLAKLGKVVPAFQKPAPDRLAQVAVELKPQAVLRAEHEAYRRPKKNVKAWPAYVLRLPPDVMREWRTAAHSLRISMAKISEDAITRHVEKLKDDHLALGGQWVEPPPKSLRRAD
jgi:hypothetical protein